MKWLIAVAWINPETFKDPVGFLSNPQGRIPPQWSAGTIDAPDKDSAYEGGLTKWCQGELTEKPPHPANPEFGLINWFVVPMPAGGDEGLREPPEDMQPEQAVEAHAQSRPEEERGGHE